MEDNQGNKLLALLMLLLLMGLVGGYLGWTLKPCPCNEAVTATTVLRIDTVTKVIEHEPIYVKAPAVVRYERDTITQTDTIIQTRPFVASLDTIIKRDTLGVEYRFPQHSFAVAFRRAADSVRIETKTITLTRQEHRPWWIDALTHVGAGAVGFVIGRSR